MIYEIINTASVSSLFAQWEETLIWSCLQGTMGKIYADDLNNPTAAMAIIGDFTFFAGKPNIEIVSYKPNWCTQNFMIMVPQNENWQNTITHFYGEKAKIVSRYATKKEPDIFDKEKLQKAIAFFRGSSLFYSFSYCNCRLSLTPERSLITSPARIRPATDGTNAMLPGMSLRSVHFLAAPGGQMQCVLQLMLISSSGRMDFSSE